jgi:hypothetical protein
MARAVETRTCQSVGTSSIGRDESVLPIPQSRLMHDDAQLPPSRTKLVELVQKEWREPSVELAASSVTAF